MPKTKKETPPLKKNIFKKAVHNVRVAHERHQKTAIHRSFRLSRRSELPKLEKLPSAIRLMKQTGMVLLGQRSIIIVLLVLYVIIAWAVNGMFALTDFAELKNAFLAGEDSQGFSGVVALLDSFFTVQTDTAQQNQPALIMLNLASLLFWLAFIWVARYEIAKKITGVREALYTSGTALVPFILLLGVIFIQSFPGAYGFSIAGNVATGKVFIGGFEVAMFSLLAFLLVTISVYFIIGSIMALQVVALPGMYPWKALRNAQKLVAGQRFSLLRKYLMAAVVMAAVWIAFFVPTLMLENAVCGVESCWVGITILPLVYYLLLGIFVMFASTYLYIVYRALLDLQKE
ncbi:MAG TPA: hypothetical protein VFZ58_04715 [Candidatus Saccharimonadales bacterium]